MRYLDYTQTGISSSSTYASSMNVIWINPDETSYATNLVLSVALDNGHVFGYRDAIGTKHLVKAFHPPMRFIIRFKTRTINKQPNRRCQWLPGSL